MRGIVSVVVGACLLAGCSREIAPSIKCARAGTGPISERILIFGESWAGKGRVLPTLPATVSARHRAAVIACSVGYSGYNTHRQVQALRFSWNRERITRLLRGPPTHVVLLTGINDLVQHRGASIYAHDVRELAAFEGWRGAMIAVEELPGVNPTPPVSAPDMAKRMIGRWTHDNGESAPLLSYRSALAKAHPSVRIIPYEPFSTGFASEPRRYTVDGIHLTPAAFHQYGAYLGSNLPRRGSQ